MPDSPENPAISSIIHPNEIKVEPQVVERELDDGLRQQLGLSRNTTGFYVHPEYPSNPDKNSHLLGSELTAGDRFLTLANYLSWRNFGQHQELAAKYIQELRVIHEFGRKEAYDRGFAESNRAHETTHYYQQVRLGAASLFMETTKLISQGVELKTVSTAGRLLRQKNLVAVFMETQCFLATVLQTQEEAPRLQHDLLIYTMVSGLNTLADSTRTLETLKANPPGSLYKALTHHTLALLILATQNPNLLEDIWEGRLEQADFESGLVQFYEGLLKDPRPFLEAVGSKEFQLAVDRKLIEARDELKKTLDEVSKTKSTPS